VLAGLTETGRRKEIQLWVPRIGEVALRQRTTGWRLFFAGWIGAVVFVGAFIVASSQHAGILAAVSIVLAFLVSVPCFILATTSMFRTQRMVVEFCSLPSQAETGMKRQVLLDPKAFDDWLIQQRRLYPPR